MSSWKTLEEAEDEQGALEQIYKDKNIEGFFFQVQANLLYE